MSLFAFVLLGAIAGLVGGWFVKDRGYALLTDVAIGVIGGLSGGSFFGAVGVTAGSVIGSIIATVVGAAMLIAILRVFQARASGDPAVVDGTR